MIEFTIKSGTKTVIAAQETATPGTWEIIDETAIMEFANALDSGLDMVSSAASTDTSDVPVLSSEAIALAQFNALNADIARTEVHSSDPDLVNFPALPDDHARDPDWIDRHSGMPVESPDTRALHLKNGGGDINGTGDSFQPLEREELENNSTPQRRYHFGFLRALSLPIRIYIKEYIDAPELFWQRAQVRLGWLGNDPQAAGYYESRFSDPAIATNGEYFVDTVRTEVQPGHTLERIEITETDLPAGVDKNRIHWLEIQGMNFPADAPYVTTLNGSEIWFKVCAAPGAPLPLKGKVNVTFLLDYTENIAADQVKKDALKNAISAAVAEFNSLSTLYGDPALFRFSLRVIGAIGAGRDLIYDSPEYQTYAEEDSSLMFTNSVQSISFNDGNTADQVLSACNAVIDDVAIRPAYSPLWRGVCETMDDFEEARLLARTEAGWTIDSLEPDPVLKETNILLIFGQGKETAGGLLKDVVDPDPDITMASRREAAFEACQKLLFDSSLESEVPGSLSPDQKELLTSMIAVHTGKVVALSGEELDLLLQAVQVFGQHASATAGTLPSFTMADTTLSTGAVAVWNEIIEAQYEKIIQEVLSAVKSSVTEPVANTIENRLWRLLADYKIGGQSVVIDIGATDAFSSDHPLSMMGSVSGNASAPGWMEEQIRQAILNRRWCHLQCRLADSV